MNWLMNQKNKQTNKIFIRKELETKVIMDVDILANKFKERLGFKQYEVFLTKKNKS